MPEYAWICLYKQDSKYVSGPGYAKILNMAKFWLCSILNMIELRSVLDMPEHALTEFWIYLEF